MRKVDNGGKQKKLGGGGNYVIYSGQSTTLTPTEWNAGRSYQLQYLRGTEGGGLENDLRKKEEDCSIKKI